MLMVNWPFNKIMFFSSETFAFFKSFLNMYSNIPLPSCETVPFSSYDHNSGAGMLEEKESDKQVKKWDEDKRTPGI